MTASSRQKTGATMPLCTSGSGGWTSQPRLPSWQLQRDREPCLRDYGALACRISRRFVETAAALFLLRSLYEQVANRASQNHPEVHQKALAAQAPPRTLRPRFRKKSTSSSATETIWVQWANSTKIHRMSLFCLKELLVQNIGNSSGMDVLWCTALQTWPFSLLSPHPSVTRCCCLSLTWVGQSGRHLQVRGPGLVCRVCTHLHCTFTVSFVSA